MEKEPSFEQLPPPTGFPVPVEQLGNLPLDPTLPQTVELIGPDGFRFSVLKNPNVSEPANNSATEVSDTEGPETYFQSRELVDAGRLNLAPIGEVVDNLRVSYHGLRFSISRVREQRARERVAKFTRKDTLYEELRGASVGKNPAPRQATSITEKVMDSRQTSKTRKAQQQGLRALREERVHGSSDVNTKSFKAGKHTGTALRQATGQITAAEARLERATTSTLPSNKSQKYMGKMHKKHTKAERKSRQPIAAKWRTFRRLNAQDTITEQQQRAQKHLDKARDIRN